MKVLVTGATGFMGMRICTALQAADHQVAATVRQKTDLPQGIDPRFVEGIGPGTDWRAALEGIDAVVHLAARAHVMHDKEPDPLAAFRFVNTFGTSVLAEQAAAAGVRRFVYMSSIKVNGEQTPPGRPFTAQDKPNPQDPYGRSKAEAEARLRAVAEQTSLKIAVIRPALVHGPGAKGNLASLMGVIAKGWPLPLAGIHNRRSLIGLDNLAELVAATLALGVPAPFEVFLASDGEDVSTPDLVRHIAKGMGLSPRLVNIPETWLRLAGRVTGRMALIDRLCGSLIIDAEPTFERLAWRPRVTLGDGLQEMGRAYRKRIG